MKSLINEVMETNRGGKLVDTFLAKDVKEKIQNAQRRLKEFINNNNREMDNMRVSRDYTVIELNKIFKEEFGGGLLK